MMKDEVKRRGSDLERRKGKDREGRRSERNMRREGTLGPGGSLAVLGREYFFALGLSGATSHFFYLKRPTIELSANRNWHWLSGGQS